MVDSFPALLMVLIFCDLRIRTFATAEGYEELNRAISIQCPGNGIAILLTKKYLPNFNHSSFHLNNNKCTGRQLNHSHIILQTGLSDCGAVIRSFNGSYIYTNLVHGYLKNPKNCSSENITTTFSVECKKPSVQAMINKTTSESDITLRNVGSKGAYDKAESLLQTMPLLTRKVLPAKITEPPQVTFEAAKTKIVNNGEEVSFTAHVSTNDKRHGSVQRFIAVEICRATPDDNFDSEDGVTLIENGCVRKPGLCGYMFKSRSSSQTISYKVSGSSFQKTRTLYVHCRFVLCPKDDRLSLCRIGCRGFSKKMEREKNDTVMLRVGPLTINNNKAQGPRMLVLAIVTSGAVFLLLTAVGILTFYCKHRRRLKRRDTLLDNEEGLSDNERGFDRDLDTAVFEESSETLEPQLSDETDSCSILEGRKLFLNMDWTTV